MFKKIFLIFKVAVIFNIFISIINMEWTATFICLLNLILFFIADYVQKQLKYKNCFALLIYIFLILALVGGEVYFLYSKIWFLDLILHTLSSFIASGLFVFLFKVMKNSINKLLFVICIFSFSMMIASLWEITEFSIDRIFGFDMQKDTIVTEINSILLSEDGKYIVNKKIKSINFGNDVINGYIDIGLYDTIEDMICAVFGSMIFIIYGNKKKLLTL